jgi:ornithine carbamoyltransferase
MTSSASSPKTSVRHFIDLSDVTAADLRLIIDRSMAAKAARKGLPKGEVDSGAPGAGRALAMIFEKSSTRTRISFEMAMQQLGGSTVVMQGQDMQLGRGESTPDTARVMSRYVDGVMIRSKSHAMVQELADHSDIPIINALTDRSHPCQIMADIMTFEEHKGPITGRTVTWVGDGNNVAVSWIEAAARFGCTLRLACPAEYLPPQDVIDWANSNGGKVVLTDDPRAAAEGSDCIIADTWVSMGDDDVDERMKAFSAYQVNADLMCLADPDAIFMHCLPAYRGKEVTADVLDGPQSVIWDEAENRLHAQKGVLLWCFGLLS